MLQSGWVRRTELLPSHKSVHHIETHQWVVSLQLLNRAARQSFGRELQKPCSESSTGSRWNSATLELLCSSAPLVRRMLQRGLLCSVLLRPPTAPTLRSKGSCMSVTEGSGLKKRDDWRKKKLTGGEFTRIGHMQTGMVGPHCNRKTLTLICHLYLEELISCKQLKTKNARPSTSP